jgi:hypothetical protein
MSRRLKWTLWGLAGLPLLILLGGIFLQEYTFRFVLREGLSIHEESARKLIGELQAARAEVAKWKIFSETPATKDAGVVLNGLLPWEKAGDTRSVAGELISDELRGKLRAKAWIDAGPEIDLSSQDLSWMGKLADYDYWDLTSAPPIRAQLEAMVSGKILPLTYFASAPLPNIGTLVPLAKLRLLKGLKEGKPLIALREVRHLARLSYSAEDLVGAMVAVSILSAERTAYVRAVHKGLIKQAAWRPMPDRGRDIFKAVILGAVPFFSPLVPDEVLSKAFPLGQPMPGACAVIREGTMRMAAIHPHFASRFPLERDFSKKLAYLRKALDPANGCRSPDVRAYWERPGAFRTPRADWWERPDKWSSFELAPISHGVPFLGKAAGGWTLIAGLPSFWSYLGPKNPNPPASTY